ncbi:uncharacterized protein BO97DRAFT_409534 [Aspergillus homomorphus CBS 101889]|uniref:Protein kinase domain-containing protein n=1 Tax=Aspergillus homomorphus (strain CBS 101889) TaxID=1450537 RepID=A0A395HFE7_ASPHC|nr:hypothetical protein BO97DRAFT_409534 [Aspergillus homomorphus CBS 101889]RAL06622.1 hypothetical protein BO97DRAFT_409534 [Aspergillus homomorphus CBS 101889]
MEELPEYDILEFFRGAETDTELMILCYGLRFHITVSAKNFRNDSETTAQYLALLRKLDSEDYAGEESDEENDEGDPMENICFWIAFKCNSVMKLLSSEEQKPRVRTLHDWFNMQTFDLVPKAVDGKFYVESSSSQQPIGQFAPKANLSPPIQKLEIPYIEASTVKILQDVTDMNFPRRPKKVLVGSGAIRFFKPTHCSEQADREILALIDIKSQGLSDIVRTPELHELVKGQGDHTSATISGILLEYIEHHSTLADIDMVATPWHIRKKWKEQLQSMVRRLHAAGIIWGDAKPDNILVDANDDLCIIDFGGGFTEGWVDADKAESQEGDLQALSRIIDLLVETDNTTGLAV